MPLSEYVSNAQHVVDVTLGTSDAYDYKMFDDTGDIFSYMFSNVIDKLPDVF